MILVGIVLVCATFTIADAFVERRRRRNAPKPWDRIDHFDPAGVTGPPGTRNDGSHIEPPPFTLRDRRGTDSR